MENRIQRGGELNLAWDTEACHFELYLALTNDELRTTAQLLISFPWWLKEPGENYFQTRISHVCIDIFP